MDFGTRSSCPVRGLNVRANRTATAGRLAGGDEDTNAGSAGQAACRSGSGG
jgi:hypothetical protein